MCSLQALRQPLRAPSLSCTGKPAIQPAASGQQLQHTHTIRRANVPPRSVSHRAAYPSPASPAHLNQLVHQLQNVSALRHLKHTSSACDFTHRPGLVLSL